MITLGVENVALGLCPRATFSTPGSSYFNVTLTTVHNLHNVDELDIGSNKGADILRFVLNDSNSLNQFVLNFSYTAAAPPTPPPFFVRYTNRRFGHQRMYTKRLEIHSSWARFTAAAVPQCISANQRHHDLDVWSSAADPSTATRLNC